MAILLIGGIITGIIAAIIVAVLVFLIIYYSGWGMKSEKFSEVYPVTTTNLPLKFRDSCSRNDYGTLRCSLA